MDESLEQKIRDAIANPKNMGELADADRMGTVGNSDCGEMLRLWVKFKEEHGRKVIDQASFQSFGCETAIAVASMATELIRGKTAEEALALRHDELTGDLGALPPMKIHCAQLVEGALKSALVSDEQQGESKSKTEEENIPSLMDSLNKNAQPAQGRLRMLKKES
jgi:NifU-like protein involved in Fe-S cluster formation